MDTAWIKREIVDNIDVHIEEVDQTARQAKEDLNRANEFNKSARKVRKALTNTDTTRRK